MTSWLVLVTAKPRGSSRNGVSCSVALLALSTLYPSEGVGAGSPDHSSLGLGVLRGTGAAAGLPPWHLLGWNSADIKTAVKQ